MTMSWSDDVTGLTQSATPVVPYVPPHLRNNVVNNGAHSFHNGNSYVSYSTESTQHGFRSNLPGSAGSSRSGRGRGGRRGRGRKSLGSSRSLSQEVFEACEKFDDLEVSEEEDGNGGVGGGGGGGGINFDAYEDIPVEANGTDIPTAANTFGEICLGERLSENIKRCKYVRPTPIQRHAIPIAVAGRDLMACAQTGSGKTAAFCFPIISGIIKSRSPRFGGQTTGVCFPSALILTPTRELASQVYWFLYQLPFITEYNVYLLLFYSLVCGVDGNLFVIVVFG